MELTQFLDLLSGVKKVGTGYQALCPAHDDAKASLHVAHSARGIGIKCHAGCDATDVLAQLDLEFSDLFSDNGSDNFVARPTGQKEIIAEYDYKDEKGNLLYQVVRYEPKDFRQRCPNGNGWSWSVKGVRRVPYMLPELINTTGPVFIVEGEKDVHTLRVHGYVATTNAGGAGKWDASWADYFADRDVYIIPDMDEAGREHASKIADSLDSVATVRVIYLFAAKDVTEWFLNNEADDFIKLVETAPLWTTIKEEEARKQLLDEEEVFVWPNKPTDYGLFGEICRLLEPHTEADPLALYMELMAHFGNAIGAGPHYKIGGTRHRGNIFIAICGQTATARKGSAHDWVVELLRQIDPYFVDTCIIGGLASGEGVIHQVRDPKTKTSKKGEVEVVDEGVTDKRRLFFESELAGRTFVAMRREGSTLSAVLRQAWDCSNLNVATKQNDDRATNPHISVVGHTTLKELLSIIRPEDVAGGTANRFLYFVVSRSKELAVQTEPKEEELRLIATKLRRSLEEARKISRVELSKEGTERWREIYGGLNREMADLDEQTVAWLARGPAQILRMALILALSDSESKIQPRHLDQALLLFEYSRSSVEFMLGRNTTGLSQEEERLYALLDKEGPKMTSEVSKVLHWNGAKVKMIAARLATRKMLTMTSSKKEAGARGRPAIWLSV